MTYNKLWANPDNHQYEEFIEIVRNGFDAITKKYTHLFTTNAEFLYDQFLEGILPEHRQHYTCRACRQFIEKYGNLVAINPDGTTVSAIWSADVPDFFKPSVELMRKNVESARVTGAFKAEQGLLGQPRTGIWEHLYVVAPATMIVENRRGYLTAHQVVSEKREEYGMLNRGLQEFTFETVNQAEILLKTDVLYRAEKYVKMAEWLKELHITRMAQPYSRQKDNIVWLAVMSAPTGYCHVKSGMIGSLLEDIQNGLPVDEIKARFDEKMNPQNYMRSQSAPSVNAIREAEKIVAEMGVANSLQRRYATIEELPKDKMLWTPSAHNHADKGNTVPTGGVFSGLMAKAEEKKPMIDMEKVAVTMTWEKFVRTTLGTADSIEVLINNPNRLMALVTAQDETAPNILKWNNTFSWYYHGGVDGEIKRRVEEAGGRYEDNEIRCSLIWENYTDLDLHCITPRGRHIYFSDKRDASGGYLDIDMNAGGRRSMKPVENIRWANNAPEGTYKFYVHNYSERGNGATSYRVELEINGQIFHYNGEALSQSQKEIVFEFDYVKGQVPRIKGAQAQASDWNIRTDKFIPVKGIVPSPNLWEDDKLSYLGNHMFFILDGCRDDSEGKGRGFFNEMLTAELHKIKKTLEAFTANTPIMGKENATACGVGFTPEHEWNLTLRVTTNGIKRLVYIDRWD